MAGDSWLPDSAELRRSPTVLYRQVLDGVLVLGPGADEPLLISSPGDVVWDLLADGRTVVALYAELSGLYGVPESVVRKDIDATLRAMYDAGAMIVST